MTNDIISPLYSLSFTEREGILRALIEGETANFEIAKRYWHDIATAAIEGNFKRLLVIENVPEAISVAEVHQLVSEMADLPVRNIKVAFVDLFPEHKSLNEFGTLVAENRGLRIKIFENESVAIEWLVSE